MVKTFQNILVIQTAFIGDAILTLPIVQIIKKKYSNASIDVVAIPRTAGVFANHPAISEIIVYDKRGKDKGAAGLFRIKNQIGKKNYDIIIVPHRSLRSALLAWLIKPKISVGFNRSAGKWLFKEIVRYDSTMHEIDRNISLLKPLGLTESERELPQLYPSLEDKATVDRLLIECKLSSKHKYVTIAPGTIWNTKRWPTERFAVVCRKLINQNVPVILIGGKEDKLLCEEIIGIVQSKIIFNTAGRLTLLQSAEIIRRGRVLVTNDSAPMHIGVSVGTPVVAIFGATAPEFGFAPVGKNDIIVEIKGLKCRPCAIHGGKKCPIKTFECMISISPELVFEKIMLILENK